MELGDCPMEHCPMVLGLHPRLECQKLRRRTLDSLQFGPRSGTVAENLESFCFRLVGLHPMSWAYYPMTVGFFPIFVGQCPMRVLRYMYELVLKIRMGFER